MPVSVRPRGDSGPASGDGTLTNKVSAMFAELPVGIEDPVERLHAITAQLAGPEGVDARLWPARP